MHKVIRRTQLYDDDFDAWDEWAGAAAEDEDDEIEADADDQAAQDWRDEIAQKLWDDYVAYLLANP